MKLIEAPDDDRNHIYHRLVSEDGKVFMGIYPVVFGFRVRAGFVGEGYVHLDWCCGSESYYIAIAYVAMRHLLSKKDSEDRQLFRDIPSHSRIKPYFNDAEFITFIFDTLTSGISEEDILRDSSHLLNLDMAEMRRKQMQQLTKTREYES